MDWPIVLLIIFGSLVVLMAMGFPVALSFIIINIVGVAIVWQGEPGLHALTLTMQQSVGSFLLLPIPMFIFLGEILFRSGMAMRAIDVIDMWLGRLPGRLGLLAVLVATLFSTMSGATSATTAMLGETLGPEMEKRGYKKSISIGSIMGSGGLAMLIPPSAAAVFWAAIAEVSIGRILIGGIVPGLVIAFFYSIYIVGRCYLQPSVAPPYKVTTTPLSKKLSDTVRYVLPLAFIVFMVTGLILLGVASPSESAVMGVVSGLILAAAYRRLNWPLLKQTLISTLSISVFIFIIISGAKAFGQVLATTGAGREMVMWVTSLPLSPILIVIGMLVILLFMGMFMHGIAIIMITVPVYMPVIYALGFDPVWFGIMFLVLDEMSQTTPPFGILLFVMKGVSTPDTTMGDIIKAGIPFLICDAACVAVVMAFPILALWLPNLLMT